MCVAQPIVWFECERKLRTGHRADTHRSGALLNPVSCLVPCLLNEWSSLANLWTSGARRLLSERVWNSLVVVTRSHVWKTAWTACRCGTLVCLCFSVQRQLNCGNSLNSRLWRAIRFGPRNGRGSSASVATASECVDGSECCTRGSVARSTEHRTRSCRTALRSRQC